MADARASLQDLMDVDFKVFSYAENATVRDAVPVASE
jgi:hypothetical protein